MNMPAGQNRSNFAFRNGFLRLATVSTAQSGLKPVVITLATKYLKVVIPAPHLLRDKLQPVEDSDLSENPGGHWMPDQSLPWT